MNTRGDCSPAAVRRPSPRPALPRVGTGGGQRGGADDGDDDGGGGVSGS